MFQIWYPSQPSATSEYSPYIGDITLFQDYVREWGERVADLPTRSVLNAEAEITRGRFRVVPGWRHIAAGDGGGCACEGGGQPGWVYGRPFHRNKENGQADIAH